MPTGPSWTEATALATLRQYVQRWKTKGWNYAADALDHVANDRRFDLNVYAHHLKVAQHQGWRTYFKKHIESEVKKLANGRIEFGELAMKDWPEGREFEGDHRSYFIDRSRPRYQFGNSAKNAAQEVDELFFALKGSHFNYYAEGCKSDDFYYVNVTILLWDPFTYPSVFGTFVDTGYSAAFYLQTQHGYGLGVWQYAVWKDKFSNLGSK